MKELELLIQKHPLLVKIAHFRPEKIEFKDKRVKLDLGSIRSSPRNGIGSISNKKMEFWYQVGPL